MMLHGWLSGFQILILACALTCSNVVDAQYYSGAAQPVRQSNGWRPSTQRLPPAASADSSIESARSLPSTERVRDSASQLPGVQTAYFQAQGSLSDGLPQFPGAVAPTGGQLPLPNDNGMENSRGSGGMVSPPFYPPQNVSPPSQMPMGNMGAQAASGELRSPQSERLPNQQSPGLQQNQTMQGQSRPDPRLQQSTLPAGQGTRLDAQQITTGLPYVTPAPRGRYATSPYQPAVFQTSYQTQPVPAQFASSNNAPSPTARLAAAQQQQYVAPQPAAGVAPSMAAPPLVAPPQYLAQQQAALPQYRYPQPGIYPTAYQCTPPSPSFPSAGAVPGAYVPPTLPPNLTPGLYTPNNSGYTPLFSLGQENYNVQLGRGIIGQPTVYVAGQPIRNFMRYLSP